MRAVGGQGRPPDHPSGVHAFARHHGARRVAGRIVRVNQRDRPPGRRARVLRVIPPGEERTHPHVNRG